MARTSTKRTTRAHSSLSPAQWRKQITQGYTNLLRDVQQFGLLVSGFCQATANAGTIANAGNTGQRGRTAGAQKRRTATATGNRRGRPRKVAAPMTMTAGQTPNFGI